MWKSLSRVQLFATPWTRAHQALSMGFSGKSTGVGYHSFLQGIKPGSPVLQADS